MRFKNILVRKGMTALIIFGLVAGLAPAPQPAAAMPRGLFKIYDLNGLSKYDAEYEPSGSNLFFVADDPDVVGTGDDELLKYTTAGGVEVVSPYADNLAWPSSLTDFSGTLFFRAYGWGAGSGHELWKSDGTYAGTVQVKDIWSGGSGSYPDKLINANGKLFFVANDGAAGDGKELWVSDGTGGGTTLVKNIDGGAGSSPYDQMTSVSGNANGDMFFESNDGTNGNELWITDGTGGGTVMVKDIHTGASNSSSPNYLATLGSNVFFQAWDGTDTELWWSDGTDAYELDINPSGSSNPKYMTTLGSKVVFSAYSNVCCAGTEPRQADTGGFSLLKDVNTTDDYIPSYPYNFFVGGSSLYFIADDGLHGTELWVSNGTDGGTMLLHEFRPGNQNVIIAEFAYLNGVTFFTVDDGTHGEEIWQTDGTPGGTRLAFDLLPGPGGSVPRYLEVWNDILVFTANADGGGYDIWGYDTSAFDSQIFTDGFESGDVSAWSSTQGNANSASGYTAEGGCTLCINALNALDEAYDLGVLVKNRKPVYVEDDSPDNTKTYHARFMVDLTQLEMEKGNWFKLFEGRKGKTVAFQIQIKRVKKILKMRARVRTDAGKMVNTKWTTLPKEPFSLEVEWGAASTKGNHNGLVQMWIDGVTSGKMTKAGVNNDKLKVDTVRMGVTGKIKKAYSIHGFLFLDAFDSDETDYIGP